MLSSVPTRSLPSENDPFILYLTSNLLSINHQLSTLSSLDPFPLSQNHYRLLLKKNKLLQIEKIFLLMKAHFYKAYNGEEIKEENEYYLQNEWCLLNENDKRDFFYLREKNQGKQEKKPNCQDKEICCNEFNEFKGENILENNKECKIRKFKVYFEEQKNAGNEYNDDEEDGKMNEESLVKALFNLLYVGKFLKRFGRNEENKELISIEEVDEILGLYRNVFSIGNGEFSNMDEKMSFSLELIDVYLKKQHPLHWHFESIRQKVSALSKEERFRTIELRQFTKLTPYHLDSSSYSKNCSENYDGDSEKSAPPGKGGVGCPEKNIEGGWKKRKLIKKRGVFEESAEEEHGKRCVNWVGGSWGAKGVKGLGKGKGFDTDKEMKI